MSVGLIALLDDIAAMAKLAAASIDDIGAASARASAKAAGVVIDDAAVTPRYVTGLTPDRELPIIARIAKGSLRNKLLFLLPAALLLSSFAPWALTPLLMLGGTYLCFEGAEKLIEKFFPHQAHAAEEVVQPTDAQSLESSTVSGAIRTDFILSAEIMAISLATVAEEPLLSRALILIIVSIAITAGVYGVVALIVKLDDMGLHLCRKGSGFVKRLGGGMVKAMPIVLRMLTVIGTVAMLWVGGGIVVHGFEVLGWAAPAHLIEAVAEPIAHGARALGPILGWLISAALSALAGLLIGALVLICLSALSTIRGKGK
jgi:predicted DNA repair protein MutK